MTVMNYNWRTFKNYGYIFCKLTDEQLAPIKKEIHDIQSDFDKYEHRRYTKNLAGNIRREYSLEASIPHLSDIVLPLSQAYDEQFDYTSQLSFSKNKHPLFLPISWVNFQKKYEFNPTHSHDGVMSYVIYISVPYSYEDEVKYSPGSESNNPSAGTFEFVYANSIGGVVTETIPIDKNMENTILVFPSKFAHHVHPFYSSDGFRVSVSGNIRFNV